MLQMLQVENERLQFEKEILNLEESREESFMKQLSVEKEKAQCLATQLSSDVQHLKNSSMLAQERFEALQKFHEQEVRSTPIVNTVLCNFKISIQANP